jgi:hypothetical protein
VIGGSFVPRGGQNLIEACAAGVPVVFGPACSISPRRRALRGGGRARQAGTRAARSRSLRLLCEFSERRKMGAAGRTACERIAARREKHLELCAGTAQGSSARLTSSRSSSRRLPAAAFSLRWFVMVFVARHQQVAAGREHLLLRVQHVDVDAHAHFVASLFESSALCEDTSACSRRADLRDCR